MLVFKRIRGIRGIMGIRGIRGISSSHSHSHSHSLTITNNGGGLRPPPQRWAAASRPPTFVESIVGDGEAANIAKTYAYTYQMCPYFYILLIYYIYLYTNPCKGCLIATTEINIFKMRALMPRVC